jgi:hypothetical protein
MANKIPTTVIVGIVIEVLFTMGALCVWLILGAEHSAYYSIGPSEDLKLFPTNIVIDTWPKYLLLICYLFIQALFGSMAADFIYPWINNTALSSTYWEELDEEDPHEGRVYRTKVFTIINLFWIIAQTQTLVIFATSYSQVGFALISISGGILGGIISSYTIIFKEN